MAGEYVGIDFHRRRSVVVRMSPRGKRLSVVRINNSPAALAEAVSLRVIARRVGGDVWLVLGGGRVAGAGCNGAPGQPESVELG